MMMGKRYSFAFFLAAAVTIFFTALQLRDGRWEQAMSQIGILYGISLFWIVIHIAPKKDEQTSPPQNDENGC